MSDLNYYDKLMSSLHASIKAAEMTGHVSWATLMAKAEDAIQRLCAMVEEDKDTAKLEDKIISEMKRQIPRWIPVTERLPEKRKYVLVRYKNNDMAVACWFDGNEDILFWRAMTDEGWCADCDTDPTHWMPLPARPKEVDE